MMYKLARYAQLLSGLPRIWFQRPLFGFVQGSQYLSEGELSKIKRVSDFAEGDIVQHFEREFAKIVGAGQVVSFASGRMGFYALMKVLDIGAGDEVILLGSTCAVMVNAVIRTGATAVFSDIDPETFGSSAAQVERCLSPRTRMIVAQHSFGIPCDIQPILLIGRKHGIFVLEDCALSLGSTIDGVPIGNFGHAALFSTDHSKPINTLVGGLVYSRDTKLVAGLRQAQAEAGELPRDKKTALWKQFLRERRDCWPDRYGRRVVMDLVLMIANKLRKQASPFLDDDSGTCVCSRYPYPAKLPTFIAAIGLHEVRRWPEISGERKSLLERLLVVVSKSDFRQHLPKAYFNPRLSIVPLRLAWSAPEGAAVRKRLSRFVHVSWTWFMQPIVAAREPLTHFGYATGMCPIAESLGKGMVNLPCNLSKSDSDRLVAMLSETIGRGRNAKV